MHSKMTLMILILTAMAADLVDGRQLTDQSQEQSPTPFPVDQAQVNGTVSAAFSWTTESDPPNHQTGRPLVSTILHAMFLSGLIICCFLGVCGIIVRYCRGLPQVEKFAPN